jgi:hypothetical protein
MTKDSDRKALGFKNVIMLSYVSLFTYLSTEMFLGILPFFIVSQLGASAILGIIEGSAEAVNNTFRVCHGSVTPEFLFPVLHS